MKNLKKIICFVLLFTILIPNTTQVAAAVNEDPINQVESTCILEPDHNQFLLFPIFLFGL